MNLAAIKDLLGVAEDEVDVTLDVAVCEVLASSEAGAGVGRRVAGLRVGVKGVLVAEQANVTKDFAVADDAQRDGLRALCGAIVVLFEVVSPW